MLDPKQNDINPKLYSPLGLAYMGDVVYEMMVREKIVLSANMPVNRLHKTAVSWVCASAQSKAIELIMDMLTEEEIAMFKRGRNANGNHVPKNANAVEYRRATGFETLFGFLYLSGKIDRLKELFEYIWENLDKNDK